MQGYKTYRHHFRRLFGELEEPVLQHIFETGAPIALKAGEYLFREGQRQRTFYIVVSGRLRAVRQVDGQPRILGDIGEGEPVGEFALFTEEPRMADVLAIRESAVLAFSYEDYEALIARQPALATAMANFVIKRLRRNTFEQHKSSPPRNIALLQLSESRHLGQFIAEVEEAMGPLQVPIRVWAAGSLDGRAGLGQLEAEPGLNILVCRPDEEAWAQQCILYADLIVCAADFAGEAALTPTERAFRLYEQGVLHKPVYLLLLHGSGTVRPANTRRWLKPRKVDLHIHARPGDGRDIRRFCRIISHRAVGLVLGGGGAKGYAHQEVAEALFESGIEVDFLGGTSAGAVHGMALSHTDFDFQKMKAISAESAKSKLTSNDFALPMVSMMTGRKVKGFIQRVFGDAHVEDLWVNSYCVSTNFSKARPEIHEQGLLWKQVQASIAIPGIFPPVVINQYLHVDGAVMDNVPIEPMYRYPVGHIIAVSLSGLSERKANYEEPPSSWRILWDKTRGRRKIKIPGLASLIINSLMLNSLQRQEQNKSKASLYLELDLKGIGFLDDRKWQEIRERGYQQTKAYLKALSGEARFWEQVG